MVPKKTHLRKRNTAEKMKQQCECKSKLIIISNMSLEFDFVKLCHRYTLLVKNKQALIDIPPRFVKLKEYRSTLGHKGKSKLSSVPFRMLCVLNFAANHSFRQHNAEFHPFHFHPVLGSIMAVVAVKDISKGSEVKDT